MRHERDESVIDVNKAEHLRVILTTRVRREDLACTDVENVLFLYGGVTCKPITGVGIALVFTSYRASPHELAKLLASRNVRAHWAIPVDLACRASYEDVYRGALNLLLAAELRRPLKLVGRCRRRGTTLDSCSRLLKFVGERLEALGLVEVLYSGYDYVLRIELLERLAALSLYHRDEEEAFRVKASLYRRLGLAAGRPSTNHRLGG